MDATSIAVGIVIGILCLPAARELWRRRHMDPWDRSARKSRHLRKYYESRDKQRERVG